MYDDQASNSLAYEETLSGNVLEMTRLAIFTFVIVSANAGDVKCICTIYQSKNIPDKSCNMATLR